MSVPQDRDTHHRGQQHQCRAESEPERSAPPSAWATRLVTITTASVRTPTMIHFICSLSAPVVEHDRGDARRAASDAQA